MRGVSIEKINKVKQELKQLESWYKKQQDEKFKNELINHKNQLQKLIKIYQKFEYKNQLDEFLEINHLEPLKKFFNSEK